MNTTRRNLIDALRDAEVHATVDDHPVRIIGVGGLGERRSTHAIVRHPDGRVRLHKHTDVLLDRGAA